jgi:hypothetical protein
LISEQIGLEVKFKEKLRSEDYRGLEALNGNVKKKFLVNLAIQDDKHLLPFSIIRVLESL